MTKALKVLVVALAFGLSAYAQAPAKLKSSADVTGTGVAVQLFPSGGTVRMVVIIADPANSSPVRCGDSSVTASRGSRIAPGGGLTYPPLGARPIDGDGYDLSTLYCFVAAGDKVSLSYAQ